MLNEACNEAQKASVLQPAALMSEHKDHRQDGNNWRAAGNRQQLIVYRCTTCDGHKTLKNIVALGHIIILSVHIRKHETCVTVA